MTIQFKTVGREYTDFDFFVKGVESVVQAYPCNTKYPADHKKFYVPDNYITAEHLSWFYDKTGFELPESFYPFMFSVPPLLTKDLVDLPLTVAENHQYCGGIGFCNSDGDILQYRPTVATFAKYVTVKNKRLTETHSQFKQLRKPIFIEGLNKQSKYERILTITEGLTKAACLAWSGFDSIHIPGVTMWDTPAVKNMIAAILPNYDRVVLAFDKDWTTNLAVKKQLLKCAKFYKADVATWEENAKGFDDLMLLMGTDDRKGLREIITLATTVDTGYFISDRNRPYYQMEETIKMNHPELYFDGTTWVNKGDTVKANDVTNLLILELQKFYWTNKFGNQYVWATKYREPLEFLKMALTKELDSGVLYLQNGHLNKGVFKVTDEPDPRAQRWSKLPVSDEPTEIVNFFQRCHGSLDIRYWARAILDNQIPYGAILGLVGASGSGKSVTFSIIKKILRRLDIKDTPLTQLDKTERLAGLGSPRFILQSDCQAFPHDLGLFYMLSDANPIEVRKLYQTNLEQKTIYSRIAFGAVNIPYVSDVNGGFSRRLKTITCSSYPDMAEDVQQILTLLEEPEYVERFANWCLDSDLEETLKFTDTTATKKMGPEVTGHPCYHYVDKVLIDKEADHPMSVEEFYEGYCVYTQRSGRTPLAMVKFREFLSRLDIKINPAVHIKVNGEWYNAPETIWAMVDSKLAVIIDRRDGTFAAINNQYFLTKQDNLTAPDPSKQQIIKYVCDKSITGEDTNLDIEGFNNLKNIDNLIIQIEPGAVIPCFIEDMARRKLLTIQKLA